MAADCIPPGGGFGHEVSTEVYLVLGEECVESLRDLGWGAVLQDVGLARMLCDLIAGGSVCTEKALALVVTRCMEEYHAMTRRYKQCIGDGAGVTKGQHMERQQICVHLFLQDRAAGRALLDAMLWHQGYRGDEPCPYSDEGMSLHQAMRWSLEHGNVNEKGAYEVLGLLLHHMVDRVNARPYTLNFLDGWGYQGTRSYQDTINGIKELEGCLGTANAIMRTCREMHTECINEVWEGQGRWVRRRRRRQDEVERQRQEVAAYLGEECIVRSLQADLNRRGGRRIEVQQVASVWWGRVGQQLRESAQAWGGGVSASTDIDGRAQRMAMALVVGSRDRPNALSGAELCEAAEVLAGKGCRNVIEPLTRWAKLVYLVEFEPKLHRVRRHVWSM